MKRAGNVIGSITQIPLFALIIASLAVFNAVVASTRARFWQRGGLRAGRLQRHVEQATVIAGGGATWPRCRDEVVPAPTRDLTNP